MHTIHTHTHSLSLSVSVSVSLSLSLSLTHSHTLPHIHTHTLSLSGSSVRQREMITPHVVGVCVLVEGGPGAAHEAQQFSWAGSYIVPVRMTGGAAGGLFNVPQTIFQRPPAITEDDWSMLGNSEATPTEIAAAIVRIVRTLNIEMGGATRKRAEFRGAAHRSETLPRGPQSPAHKTSPTSRKRTFSDGRRQPKFRTVVSSYS